MRPLRFRPTEEDARAGAQATPQGSNGAVRQMGNEGRAGRGGSQRARRNGPGNATASGRPRNATMLWYLDDQGKLAVARVHTGLTDGQRTEVKGESLKEGMQVIVGVTPDRSRPRRHRSPFQPQTPTHAAAARRLLSEADHAGGSHPGRGRHQGLSDGPQRSARAARHRSQGARAARCSRSWARPDPASPR